MLKPHVVRAGEYWTKLSAQLGFDADEVWSDPKNDEIRKLRTNRDILCTGDVVYVPDKPAPGLRLKMGTENKIVAKLPKSTFQQEFSVNDKPLANEEYTVEGLGEEVKGTTDGDGKASFEVPIHIREVQVVFAKKGIVNKIKVGDLDPMTETTGVRMRLAHLQYIKGPPSGDEEQDAKALADAVTEFQKDQKLDASGKMDGPTEAALKEAHGS